MISEEEIKIVLALYAIQNCETCPQVINFSKDMC